MAAEPMSHRWKSPTYTIHPSLQSSTLVVPESGLYAFSFGLAAVPPNVSRNHHSYHHPIPFESKRTCLSNTNYILWKDSTTTISTSPLQQVVTKGPTNSICHCTYQAIWTDSKIRMNENDSTSFRMELPWKRPNNHPDKTMETVVTSTKVGRILYLEKGTTLSVQLLRSCGQVKTMMWKNLKIPQEHQDPTITMNGKEEEGGEEEGEQKEDRFCIYHHEWEWNLVLLHGIQKTYTSSERHDTTTTLDIIQNFHNDMITTSSSILSSLTLISSSFYNLYPPQVKDKILACMTCRRRFATTIAVQNHWKAEHEHEEWHETSSPTTMSNNNVSFLQTQPTSTLFQQPLASVYEDEDFVIVVKPQGIPVMGAQYTILNSDLLLPFLSNRMDALRKPRPVHRLDSATGGLLVVAKTHRADMAWKQIFAQRMCRKRYRAIVCGRVEPNQIHGTANNELPCSQQKVENASQNTKDIIGSGCIHFPIDSKPAHTCYNIVSYTPSTCPHVKDGWVTTVDLYPTSGRRHQLRKHMKMIGHPIWGDKRYSATFTHAGDWHKSESVLMCLWALELNFSHPFHFDKDEINVSIIEPQQFHDLRMLHENFLTGAYMITS